VRPLRRRHRRLRGPFTRCRWLVALEGVVGDLQEAAETVLRERTVVEDAVRDDVVAGGLERHRGVDDAAGVVVGAAKAGDRLLGAADDGAAGDVEQQEVVDLAGVVAEVAGRAGDAAVGPDRPRFAVHELSARHLTMRFPVRISHLVKSALLLHSAMTDERGVRRQRDAVDDRPSVARGEEIGALCP